MQQAKVRLDRWDFGRNPTWPSDIYWPRLWPPVRALGTCMSAMECIQLFYSVINRLDQFDNKNATSWRRTEPDNTGLSEERGRTTSVSSAVNDTRTLTLGSHTQTTLSRGANQQYCVKNVECTCAVCSATVSMCITHASTRLHVTLWRWHVQCLWLITQTVEVVLMHRLCARVFLCACVHTVPAMQLQTHTAFTYSWYISKFDCETVTNAVPFVCDLTYTQTMWQWTQHFFSHGFY